MNKQIFITILMKKILDRFTSLDGMGIGCLIRMTVLIFALAAVLAFIIGYFTHKF